MKLFKQAALVATGLMGPLAAQAQAIAAPTFTDATGTITNMVAVVTGIGVAMLAVAVLPRMFSKARMS